MKPIKEYAESNSLFFIQLIRIQLHTEALLLYSSLTLLCTHLSFTHPLILCGIPLPLKLCELNKFIRDT